MTERTCKTCGRPLIEEEGEYCPHCTAKRAGRMGKGGASAIAIAIGAASVAAVRRIIKLLSRA